MPWSYSSLTAFETCPRRFYLTRVSKEVVEGDTEATLWGKTVHTALEHRIRDGKPMSDLLRKYEPIAARIAAMSGEVTTETPICLTESFKQTGWTSKDAWVRGIVDLTVKKDDKVLMLDWKTGKRKHDSDQLKLFAGMAFAVDPEVKEVTTGFVWLKENKTDKEKYYRDDVPTIWQHFIPRVRRLDAAHSNNNWPAKPSGLCRSWCPVGRNLCEFCGK
jgi:hypothetical protein